MWFGSQAFGYASYNANIGAWNTASVSNMVNVSAVSAGARNAADALGGSLFDAARPLCAVAPPMCTRARVCVHVYVLACAGVYTSLHVGKMEMFVYV